MAASRGRRFGIVLVVLLVLVAGLLALSDRLAAYAAERTIATQAKKELTARNITTPTEPTVKVYGFPFLTQVARGKYDRITIHVDHPTSQGVTLDGLDVVATGVNATTSTLVRGNGTVTADDVTGTAVLNWTNVNKLMNTSGFGGTTATASALPDGEVQVRVPVSIGDISTTVVATGTLKAADTVAHLTITKVETEGGTIPPVINRLVSSIKQSLSVDIRIPQLPYNLKVRTVKAAPEGLSVTANAVNVPISGSAGS
jgi:hypothetical protein